MNVNVTLDEYISVLKRSLAPTLIVEGDDDYLAFRDFEVENISYGFTVFPVKGKSNVISIFRRREEIENEALVFLLDKDEWCFLGQSEFDGEDSVIQTDGWSIENDLLRDGSIDRLMSQQEKLKMTGEIREFTKVFSAALHCHLNGGAGPPLSMHPSQVLDADGQLRPEAKLEWVDPFEIDVYERYALENPHKNIRGKALLSLFTRQLSAPDRRSKFSRANLLEIGASSRGEFLSRIEQFVSEKILNN